MYKEYKVCMCGDLCVASISTHGFNELNFIQKLMKKPQDLDKPVLYSRKLMQIQIERDVEGPERWIA